MSPPENTQKLRLDVLKHLKFIQSRNGIAEEQHIRYRRYCTRRLHRLRTSPAIHLPVKSGKKHVKEEFTPEMMKTSDHLLIPLLLAERAWAYSQEDQTQLDDPLQEEGSKPLHLVAKHIRTRLRRAVEYSELFETLCIEVADTYTQLQATLYNKWMNGIYNLELDNYQDALTSITACNDILTSLKSLDDDELTIICTKRQTEVQLYIKLCSTRLKASGIVVDTSTLTQLVSTNDPSFKAKLAQLVLEEKKTTLSNIDTTSQYGKVVQVNGVDYKVNHNKVQNLLIEADQLLSSLVAQQQQQQQTEQTILETTDTPIPPVTQTLSIIQGYMDDASIYISAELRTIERQTARTTDNDELHRQLNGILTHIKQRRFQLILQRYLLSLYDLFHKHIEKNIPPRTILTLLERFQTIIEDYTNIFDCENIQNNDDGGNHNDDALLLKEQLITYVKTIKILYTAVTTFHLIQLQQQQQQQQQQKMSIQLQQTIPIESIPNTLRHISTLLIQSRRSLENLISQPQTLSTFQTSFPLLATALQGPAFVKEHTIQIQFINDLITRVKVLFYQLGTPSTSSSNEHTTTTSQSTTTQTYPIFQASQPDLVSQAAIIIPFFQSLQSFETAQTSVGCNLVSLIPPVLPVPPKPFIFDVAYDQIVTNHEYNQAVILARNNQQHSSVTSQSTSAANSATVADVHVAPTHTQEDAAPKSFWGRLFG